MADIFISYKREDQEELGRVRPIAEALSAEGYDVFYDVQVPPGSSWEAVLQSKINAARAVIVLWSEHSVTSDWVKEEAEMAKHAGKLIPVFLDTVSPPFGFARIEGANLTGWDGDLQNIEWRNLVAAVKVKIGSGEKAPTPDITRVAYAPAKSVTVSKSGKSGGGSGLVRSLITVAALVVIGAGAFMGWDAYQSAQFEQDRRMDEAVDLVMDREIDKRAFDAATAEDTIEAYERYLTVHTDGAFRDEAVERIAELREATAQPEPAAPATPTRPGDFSIASLSLGSTEVTTGNEVRVRLTVENSGDDRLSNSGLFTDFVLSRDTTAPIRTVAFNSTWSEDALLRGGRSSAVPPLEAGQSHTWTETVDVPDGWPAGRFNVCAVVDSAARISEHNEANNVACTPITVRAPSGLPTPVGAGLATPSSVMVNGVEFNILSVEPSGSQISLSAQNFAVTYRYAVPAGQRIDVMFQPRYSGPGDCRWGSSQPGVLTGSGQRRQTFSFSGTGCTGKTMTAVNIRVAPEGNSSAWQSGNHSVSYTFR